MLKGKRLEMMLLSPFKKKDFKFRQLEKILKLTHRKKYPSRFNPLQVVIDEIVNEKSPCSLYVNFNIIFSKNIHANN